MTNRLQKKKKNIFSGISVLTLMCLGMLVMVYFAISSVESISIEEKEKTMEELVMRTAIHCYSMEGSYPEELSYLEENYSLNLDTENYTVEYQVGAQNVAPEVTVTYNTAQEGGI